MTDHYYQFDATSDEDLITKDNMPTITDMEAFSPVLGVGAAASTPQQTVCTSTGLRMNAAREQGRCI